MKLLVLVGLGTVLGGVRSADACEPPPCWPGAFVPGDAAEVPANLPGIVWRPGAPLAADPTMVSLVATDDPSTPIALAAHANADGTFTLVPATALTPGKHYRLADATACSISSQFETPSATFTATASAPLPTSLGVTTASPDAIADLELATAVGSCSVAASGDVVDIGLVLAAEAGPWRDVLLFSTTVDGAPWSARDSINAQPAPGTSWTGRGTDRVFEVCSGGDGTIAQGATSGSHEVALHATLANTSLALDAATAPFELACGGGFGPDCDTGMPPESTSQPTGCMSASPSTPGAFAIALLVGLRRRKKVAS